MDPRTPVVVAARRTPFGTAGRGLAPISASGLAAPMLAALSGDLADDFARTAPGIDEVILGNCCGPGGDVARVATLEAGLGVEVPAVTVDRQCGSGLDAIRLAAALVGAGTAQVVLAGGVESASNTTLPRAPFAPPGFDDPEMGVAADALAQLRGVSRERQDCYAHRSHQRAIAASQAGVFDAELVPINGVARDDRPRAGLSPSLLARFRPAFTATGTVTAGNSCGVGDGAAAVAVVSEQLRAAAGVPGLQIVASAVRGVDPAFPGLGSIPAVLGLLEDTRLTMDDIAVLEVTEAFAAQVLAGTDALGLDALGADAKRVCPQGGAIALGHPWGASGAFLVVRLFAELVRRPAPGSRYGIATCAVGGGQGIAVLVERVG